MAGSPYTRILHIAPDAYPAALPRIGIGLSYEGLREPASRPPGCYTLAADKGSGAAGFKAFGFIVHYSSRRTKFVK